MFKKDLKKRMEKIFEGYKVTFDAPSDSFEQETVFISIIETSPRITGDKVTAHVEGYIQIFAQHDKLPFCFIADRIERASKQYTYGLFFHDVDRENAASAARMVNLSERTAQFVFIFSQQYNPNKGTLNNMTIEEDNIL